MISIFRKARLKLFKGNKVQKYILYAIGEVLLIVFGILLALQISNLNEKEKSKKLSNEMIAEIKSGIESDLSELDVFLSDQYQVFNSQIIVSNWLKRGSPYHDSLSIHFSKTYVAKDYSINYVGYERLKKNGLRKIENDSLRRSIANLYEIKYPEYLKFSQIYQNFLDELLDINPKHFNELNYMRPTMEPVDIKKLRLDTEYAYKLNTLKNFNQLLIFQGSLLKKEMNKTYLAFE